MTEFTPCVSPGCTSCAEVRRLRTALDAERARGLHQAAEMLRGDAYGNAAAWLEERQSETARAALSAAETGSTETDD